MGGNNRADPNGSTDIRGILRERRVETKSQVAYLRGSGPNTPPSMYSSDQGPVLLRAAGPFFCR